MGRIGIIVGSIAAIPVTYYGYALLKACTSTSGIPYGELFGAALFPNFRSIANAVVAFALAAIVYRLGSRAIRKTGLQVGLLCYLAALLAMAVTFFSLPNSLISALSLACALLQSVGTIILSALWVDLYAKLSPNRAIFANCCAIIMAQCIVLLTELNPIPRILFMLTVSILASAASYHLACNKADSSQTLPKADASADSGTTSNREKEYFPIPYKALLFIAVYSFAYGVASPMANAVFARYAAVIPSVIVILLILINSKRFDASLLFRIALPLMIGGFLLVAVISGRNGVIAALVLNAGYSAMEILLILLVCTISYGMRASAIWLFSLLAGTQFSMRVLGIQVSTIVYQLDNPTATAILGTISLVLIVMTTLSLISEKSLFAFWKLESDMIKEDGAKADRLNDGTYTLIRLNSLSAAHGLTDRETELFHLVMQGKTNLQIANDMFISEGTVKAHLHHIYQKFGISSRKELFSLVEKDN